MKKISVFLLLVFTTGCSSGKWAHQMTENERELERIENRNRVMAQNEEPHPLLQTIGGLIKAFVD